MSFFVYFSGLVLIAAVAWAAASPLLAGETAPVEAADDPRSDRWRRQKDEALAGIREAEFDRQLGKLSEDDYRQLRARLEAQALEAMAALERHDRGDSR